jgi:hypothetical protein
MDQEKKQAVALMRYSAIAPLITGLSDDYESLTAFFNNASVKGVIHPDGTLKHYAPVRLKDGTVIIKKVALMLSFQQEGKIRANHASLMMTCRSRSDISNPTIRACPLLPSTDSFATTEALKTVRFQNQP